MSALLFVCPTSGREVSTGIEMEPETFRQGLPTVLADIRCPDCGLIHNLYDVQPRLTDKAQSVAPVSPTREEAGSASEHCRYDAELELADEMGADRPF